MISSLNKICNDQTLRETSNAFHSSLLKLRQDGTLKRLHAHTWRPTESDPGPPWRSVDILEVASVLLVLAAGVVSSVLLLVVEVVYQRVRLRVSGHDRLRVNLQRRPQHFC